jgi:hypothetical protein
MTFLIVASLLGLIPATIASKKGRSFGTWWFYGAALFIVALPMAIIMKPLDETTLDATKVRPDNHVPGWIVGVVLVGAAGFIYLQVSDGGGSSLSGQSVVTMSKYEQIQNNMSYDQAVQIIGKHGVEMSRNHIQGVPGVMPSVDTVMYQWMNSGGSNMNAMFQNDKLVSKAQAGLR